jgi:hypothetical protein
LKKNNLKNLLFVALILLPFFYSCNDGNSKKAATKTAAIDSPSNSLVYLTRADSWPALLSQNWEAKEDVDDGILSNGSDLEMPFRSYCFFDDGVMVQNPRDNMKAGKWTLDEKAKMIHLVFDDGSQKDMGLSGIGVNSLLLKNGKDKPVKYVADGMKRKVVADHPFYPANNLWRKKPAQKETDEALKNRIIQCVLFYNKFLQDNADRKAKVISFYGIPSCFKWYKGGISITNKDKLNQKWIDCFYSKDQAIQGQQMLENIISKKYKWNLEEPSWIKQSAGVLLQIADSLK